MGWRRRGVCVEGGGGGGADGPGWSKYKRFKTCCTRVHIPNM